MKEQRNLVRGSNSTDGKSVPCDLISYAWWLVVSRIYTVFQFDSIATL